MGQLTSTIVLTSWWGKKLLRDHWVSGTIFANTNWGDTKGMLSVRVLLLLKFWIIWENERDEEWKCLWRLNWREISSGSQVDLWLFNFWIRQTYLLGHTNTGPSRLPVPSPAGAAEKRMQKYVPCGQLPQENSELGWACSVILLLQCQNKEAREKLPFAWEPRVGKWFFYLAKPQIVQFSYFPVQINL